MCLGEPDGGGGGRSGGYGGPGGGCGASERPPRVHPAAELARTAKSVLEEAGTPQERWQRLQEVLHQLAELRRHDHRAARLRRDQAVWAREEERLDEEAHRRRMQAIKDDALAPLRAASWVSPVAECYGGGEAGRAAAAYVLEVLDGLPSGSLNPEQPATPAEAAPPPVAVAGSDRH